MNAILKLIDSELPYEGLRFFHSLSNLVENTKGEKLKLIQWKDGLKSIKLLNCFKPKLKEAFKVPEQMPENSLYVPTSSHGFYVISQLRHAFCHANLKYDKDSNLYQIDLTDKVHIAGRFSLEAIQEFVNVYIQPKEPKKEKKK